jgi:hypothetical protein
VPGGTGLGLATSMASPQCGGGTVETTEGPDQFLVYLPLNAPASTTMRRNRPLGAGTKRSSPWKTKSAVAVHGFAAGRLYCAYSEQRRGGLMHLGRHDDPLTHSD